MQDLIREFTKPSSIYRGKPFWAWNGKLDKEELIRQVRIIKEMGFGGFFMHARTGLETPYLSDEWFELIKNCCDEAKSLSIEAWLYDEDRWPSGAAGGMVTSNEKFSQLRLKLKIMAIDSFKWDCNTLCAFMARIDGANAYDVSALSCNQKISPKDSNKKVLCFSIGKMRKSKWFNGQAYLDTLSGDAVKEFIKTTHEKYREKLASYFGNVVPGIFTDEPHHETFCEPDMLSVQEGRDQSQVSDLEIPWTPTLPKKFFERYGYDLLERIPQVFFDIEAKSVQKARHDYHDCIAHLFTESFARQIGNWCNENAMMLTGHILYESPLYKQASLVSSAMRFYEHMQLPGVDILTDCHFLTGGRSEYNTLKQCSSIQRQFGKKWMLSELYGCTGWDFPFEGFKFLGDWQIALGMNFRCVHHSWYTMQGNAKRDYPSSIFYQSPWWKQYHIVEEYFARIISIMSRGKAQRNILVIHSIESVWQQLKVDWAKNKNRPDLESQLVDLCCWLLENHLDFDYGDEEIMSRTAKIDCSKEKPEFVIGQASYTTIVVPPLLTIRSSTLELIKKFIQCGGAVVFCGELPDYVDALSSQEVNELAGKCIHVPFEKGDVLNVLEAKRVISVKNKNGEELSDILCLYHIEGNNAYLFLCNTNRRKALAEVEIVLDISTKNIKVQEWDPSTGQVYQANCNNLGSSMSIHTHFPKSGSRLFVLTDKIMEGINERAKLQETKRTALGGKWDYSFSDYNVLVLDRAEFKIDGLKHRASLEILKIDRCVRNRLAIPYRVCSAVQPWFSVNSDCTYDSTSVELTFCFNVSQLPESTINIGLENPHRYKIIINDFELDSNQHAGWWTDISIKLLPIDLVKIKKGLNVITISCDYSETSGLEAFFLLGSFGVEIVDGIANIRGLPEYLTIGDWTKQGFPFYSGSIIYKCNIEPKYSNNERIFIEFPDFAGTCVNVLINKKVLKTIGWPPYELDITEFVDRGEIELGIEVISHRRNSFGPLHFTGNDSCSGWTGPEEFITEDTDWQEDYKIVPCGLMGPPVLSYRNKKL